MNKPERPQFFSGAEGLFNRVRGAGERAWAKATEAPSEDKRRRKVVLFLAAAILIGILAIAVLSRLGGDGAAPTEVDTRQAVTVVALEPHTFAPTIALNGEARPQRDIQVMAPATGVRVLELMVDEGETVRQGQPMARLDTALSQAQIRSAQAGVAEAQSASVRARGEYERAESIRDSGALSTEAIEQRRAAAIAADARLAAAQAQLQETNARLGGGYVRAPAAGLVIDRTAEIGRSVDGQVLFRIAAGNALEIAASVAEADMLALQEGQIATFTLVDGSTVEGRLTRLPASIDPRTRTGEALFALPSGTRVRAGMYLSGVTQLAERNVLAVPQSSILYQSGEPYVFVVDGEGIVRQRPVTLGQRSGDAVEVLSGLEQGANVVGAGAAFVRDGDSVRTLSNQAPAEAAPAAEDPLRGREG